MNVFGLDVGGSGIKGAPVDTKTGELFAERVRIKTPKPATPEAIVATAVEVVRESGWEGPWKEYAGRLDEYLHRIEDLLWPDLIVMGGGISKKSDKFFGHLTARTRIVRAEMQNNAGIAGAALAGIPEEAAVAE